jgi:poly(3-hydroxybutyrate) depolymerase
VTLAQNRRAPADPKRLNTTLHISPLAAISAWALVVLGATLSGCGGTERPPAARLPALEIARDSVTVSGISGGGDMAVQFHVAYSGLVHGAGLVAAGPYYCAENSMRHALGRCMLGDEPIPTDELVGATSRLALEDAIDPIAGLSDDRVWIFHGGADRTVAKPVSDALAAYYALLVAPGNIKRVELAEAAHTFPTNSPAAGDCGKTESPYLGRCGLDGARDLLQHLYGPLRPGRKPATGELVEFAQRPYADVGDSESFAERGWLFVPAQCRKGGAAACKLHVVFHGCRQGGSFVGDRFVVGAGYLEAAAGNGIVVLFPQIEPSYQPLNPNGCWDWWGYEGDWYAVKGGPQMLAVRAMVADLLGEPRPPIP